MKEVVYFTLMPGLGGPSRSLGTLLASLSGRVRRTLVCPAGSFRDLVVARGWADEVVVLPAPKFGRADRVIAASVVTSTLLRRRGAILHCNGHTELAVAAPVVAMGLPVVAHMRTTEVTGLSARLGTFWAMLGNRADWIAVSPLATACLKQMGISGRSVTEIPNPIDASEVVGPPVRQNGGVFTVGYFGSRRTVKGFRLLPLVVSELIDVPIRFRLFVTPDMTENAAANDDTVRGLLEAGSRRVEFVGHRTDLRGEYSSCDLVFCPSERESFGRIPIEAMANGVPVVAANIPAFVRLVGDSGAGKLYRRGDALNAAEAIVALMNDPEARSGMAIRARVYASSFSPESLSRDVEAVYVTALARLKIANR